MIRDATGRPLAQQPRINKSGIPWVRSEGFTVEQAVFFCDEDKPHAHAKKCIESGLPVAIKVGDQLYLAAMDSHDSANKILAQKAGQQVTVEGTVYEKDGQKLIAISKIE